MAFKKFAQNPVAQTDPESLFRDLRSRKVQGLMSQQADMLRSYMREHTESDIALELPTGSGKTLVGLLIAEWRRLKFRERCMLLCPTNQLVFQVVEQAKEKYGIDVVGFVGSKRNYPPADVARYVAGQAIAVTNYSTLFNSHPAFADNGTLIFDDAHAAENYVAKCWSIEVSKADHLPIFNGIAGLIEQFIPEQDKLSLRSSEESPLDNQWVNKLPAPVLYSIREALVAQLDLTEDTPELYHPWTLLRQNILACNLYYTAGSILIRPLIPPTEAFLPFKRARQRIYMSATLGEGGDLERIFGTYRIKRIPAPQGWEKQGVGRRFMVFPMCTLTEDQAMKHAVRWLSKFPRALILTPSERAADEYRETVAELLGPLGYRLFKAEDIEKSKSGFIKERGVAVLANRYDGIDLLEDECRSLIVSGLPEATNLQERFLMSRVGAGIMFDVRVRTRITQAVGRCTRSPIDWALVVVVGDKTNSFFLKAENREHLHPELQAEIEFGISQSAQPPEEIEENIAHFERQDEEWLEANQQILEIRESRTKIEPTYVGALANAVKHEVEYANAMWSGHFEMALSAASDALSHLSGDELRGYRAWWSYMAGVAAFLSARHGEPQGDQAALDWFNRAATAAPSVPWLRRLKSTIAGGKGAGPQAVEGGIDEIIESMERALESLGKSNSKRIEARFLRIRKGLSQSKDAKSFEQAQVELGELLGYESFKGETDSAPDPYWIFRNEMGVVFEDYSAPEGASPRIGKNKIIQAKGHLEWLAAKHPKVQFQVVMCAATETLTDDSAPFQNGVFFLHVSEMVRFADDALRLIRSLWDTFSKPGDLAWREAAARKLNEAGFTPEKVVERLTRRPLANVGQAK